MNWMTRAAMATQIALTSYVAGVRTNLRSDDREKGGVMVEYIGVIIVVVAIVALIVGLVSGSGIGDTIIGKIEEAVDSLAV